MLKNVYINVPTVEISKLVQARLFELGNEWYTSGKRVMAYNEGWVDIDPNGKMCNEDSSAYCSGDEFKLTDLWNDKIVKPGKPDYGFECGGREFLLQEERLKAGCTEFKKEDALYIAKQITKYYEEEK